MKQILVSAGDALTAKLVEEAGFGGVWVSGFEVSARMGLADNGSLTMTEMLNVCRPIVEAVKIPVYVDVDTGYGNFARTVKEFKKIGVKGICVQDDEPFSKKNSLWGGKTPLMDMKEFSNKISVDSKIIIIARTEALIRGYGLAEALKRGLLYSQVAPIVLIHTRDEQGIECREIARKWHCSAKLAIVPTKFPHFTNKRLFGMGYSMVIWANQTERVKIKAIRQALKVMKTEDDAYSIELGMSATLDDMKGLTPDG